VPGEWGGTASAYAASFARLCAGSVDAVLDVLGEPGASGGTLLDAGTGTGTLARAAAARGWDVDACDPEPSMIAWASSHDAEGVRFREAGLPSLPWDERAFDAVTANFVINHTPSPRAALRELVRVARGRVAVTIWPRVRTELNGLWGGIVRDAGASTPPGTALPPEEEIERTEDGLTALLAEAGLADARTRTLAWDFAIAPDELWTAVAAGVATIGTTYLAQDDATRPRMRDAYRERTAAMVHDDGLLHLPTWALLGTGTRDAS
jgi:SAM-dependent methyltransferase